MTAAEVAEVTEETRADAGGKYLTFGLGDEVYGLEILKVREIIGMMGITAVPRTPEEVVGVINLRGNVIPIIDLRLKFGMPREDRTEETCMIVVDVDGMQMGVVVDRVLEVLDIAAGGIQDAPSFGVDVNTDFILGIGKAGDRVTILLDIARVLNTAAARQVAEAQSASEERES
jgi:purine-binding chemotaxis protein CheW